MTGENLKRINRNADIKTLKEKLDNARGEWGDCYKNLINDIRENGEKSLDELIPIENKIKNLEYELDCAEEEDRIRRNWR